MNFIINYDEPDGVLDLPMNVRDEADGTVTIEIRTPSKREIEAQRARFGATLDRIAQLKRCHAIQLKVRNALLARIPERPKDGETTEANFEFWSDACERYYYRRGKMIDIEAAIRATESQLRADKFCLALMVPEPHAPRRFKKRPSRYVRDKSGNRVELRQ